MKDKNTRQSLTLFFRYLFIFSLLSLFLYGCKKYDTDNIAIEGIDAEYAIPLINTSTSLQDLLENFDSTTFIQFQDDGLIVLNYKGDVQARTSQDLFDVLGAFDGVPIPLLDTSTFIPYNPVNNVDIDFAILKTGTLKWGFQSFHQEPITVTITLPTVTKDGVPLTDSQFGGAYSGSGDAIIGGNLAGIDLQGYRLATTNDTIYLQYVAHRINSGINDTLEGCYIIFEDLTASYIEGYLGNDLYDFERDTIQIDFFENWTQGNVYFEDPKLTLRVENSFGLPVRTNTNFVNVITTQGELLELESIFLDSIDVAYPSLSEVGEVKYTVFHFDKTNSNIDVLLSSNPIAIDYDVDAEPNPDSLTSIRGFLTDSSYFKVQLEAELPIYGRASDFEARDTFSINFDDFDELSSVAFKILTENEIPLDVGIQLYFADEQMVLLDSMFAQNAIIIAAASVDQNGNPTGSTKMTSLSDFDEDRYNGIRSAKHLIMKARFSTSNDGTESVKVYKDNTVQIKVGMKLGIEK